jgi:uncharacterized protein (DUF433 family)
VDLPDFLIDHTDGEIRLVGRRISLYDVINRHQEGDSAEMIAEAFELDPQRLQQILTYYAAHQAEVDAYVAGVRAEIERQADASPVSPGQIAIRGRLEELRRSEVS